MRTLTDADSFCLAAAYGLEEVHLGFGGVDLDFLARACRGGGEGDGVIVGLEFPENFARAIDDCRREAGEAGNLNSVAAVGGAGDDLADEDDFVVPLLDRYGEIAETREGVRELGQFVIMRRE